MSVWLDCGLRWIRRRSRAGLLGVLGGAALAFASWPACSVALANSGPPTVDAAAGSLCSLASAKRVKATIGPVVSTPSSTSNGPVTVCQFTTPAGLLVRFQRNESSAAFAAAKRSFPKHGEPVKSVNGLGSAAYSSTLAHTNTIVVLQNSTELLIVAAAPLTKVTALAKLILPSL